MVDRRMMTQSTLQAFSKLLNLRNLAPNRDTVGMSDQMIKHFLSIDAHLSMAIEEANERQKVLSGEFGMEMMSLPESELVPILQADFINFYAPATVNPYVALAACGP
tara:strand:+ start:285 stop:605 length:321 start_codon:yes stop_codon:yes gene_type:complete